MALINKKLIIVNSKGNILPLGGVFGPIKTPFVCSTKKILDLVSSGHDVHEVSKDGKTVKIDINNYNTSNFDVIVDKIVDRKVDKVITKPVASFTKPTEVVEEVPKEEPIEKLPELEVEVVKEETMVQESVVDVAEPVEAEEAETVTDKKQYQNNQNGSKKNRR